MKAFFNEDKNLFVKICLFAISYALMFEFLWPNGLVGKILFGLFALISIITLFFGMIVGLIVSLFFLFTMGSIILFLAIQNIEHGGFYSEFLTMKIFVLYGVGLLLTNLFGGYIYDQLSRIVMERNKLRQEIKLFVAIDPDTSFDNSQRLEIEMKREMNRINRYGGKFTILFLEMDNYNEFSKTYGQKELDYLLKTIGMRASESLRYSDRKFRYSNNKFAFLLIETPKDNAELVAEKIGERLGTHQLLSGKSVTLSFHISYEEYNQQMGQMDYLQFIHDVEKETVFYGL
ncbi:GGDEF domain-containing protein [Ornithinibacillus salinisoli]|uniref:GGDEF domain-containing protein n=1 Tax=Ornithinibacillus salinisoli TaxID=1848459 RepID=A0ABW4VX41_9BACI